MSESFFLIKQSCRPQACKFTKKTLWHKHFPVNFAKFLRTFFLQTTFERLLLKWNKMKCLPLLIAFSNIIINHVIVTTSIWCWKKISNNVVTSILIRNRCISRCISNRKTNVATILRSHWEATTFFSSKSVRIWME